MTSLGHPSYRHAYLAEIFDRLEAGDTGIKAKVHALMALWKAQPEMNPWLWQTWERLLERPVAEMRAAVLADTQDGDMLRHARNGRRFRKRDSRTRIKNTSKSRIRAARMAVVTAEKVTKQGGQ